MLCLGLLGIVEVSESESGYIIPFRMKKVRVRMDFKFIILSRLLDPSEPQPLHLYNGVTTPSTGIIMKIKWNSVCNACSMCLVVGIIKWTKYTSYFRCFRFLTTPYCKENLFILLATNIWASSTEWEEEGEWTEEQTCNKTSTIKP